MAASTRLHSNAFNFMSFINGGVDARTGLYNVSIALPELKTDDLAGPVVALALAFSPLNTQDTGYGLGWNLQLTQYSPDSRILSLSTGETFKVTETAADGQMLMKEKKLDSFHAHDLGNDRYRIVHKSGLVEILELQGAVDQAVALPVEIHSADGRTATLTYGDYYLGHPLLTEVRDAQRRLLTLARTSSRVEVVLHPDQVAVPFVMTLDGADNRVSRITLPTDEQAGWRLNYEQLGGLLCITEVWTPTGAHETVLYDDPGHAFPLSAQRPNLRRVTEHVTDPAPYHGFNPNPGPDPEPRQPSIEVRYSYGATGVSNTHNFLGHDASGLIWEDDGLDNLYRIVGSYLYATTEILHVAGQTVRSTERTFNRFHLLTEQRVTQHGNVKKTVTVYHGPDGTDFDDQLPNFQLPATVTDTWYSLDNPNLVRHETVRSEYDRWGNLTEQVQANGVAETSTWYPAAGELDGAVVLCPPDPHGFVRQIKSRTVTPVAREPQDPLNPDDLAPVLLTRYRYQALTPVGGSGTPWLVLNDERLLQRNGATETLLQQTAQHYFIAPLDALRHGRPRQQQVSLNGHDTLTTYTYEKTTGRAGETVLVTTQTLSSSLDAEIKVITLEHSLLTGESLLTRDDTDVEIRYVYDALGRVLSETVAPGTDYVATRNYAYRLVANNGEQAWQEATDVKGVTVRSHLDGLSRVVSEQRQDTEAAGKPLRHTYRAQYDARGQLTSETEYDWLPGKPDLVLTRHFGYDDWGQPVSETGPDGVVTYTVTDPFGWTTGQGLRMPTTSSWQQIRHGASEPRHGLTVTRLNTLQKPDEVERFTLSGESLGRQFYRYDGLGRTLETIDTQGNVTVYRYDPFDRLVRSILPNGDQVLRSFAAHSSAEWVSQLQVQPAATPTVKINAGEQAFDGMGRLIQLKVGLRTEKYLYDPGQIRAREHITASGTSIHYRYAPGLTQEPISTETLGEQVSFDYDVKSAYLKRSTNNLGSRHYEYDTAGHLKSSTWDMDGDTWTSTWSSSLQGRPLQRSAVGNVAVVYTHDAIGRVKQVTQGNLQATFTYDALGRTAQTLTTDLGSGANLQTLLQYDAHSREILRTQNLSGHAQRTLSQVWRNDDQLLSRHLQEAGTSLLLEEFSYDNRGRLRQHKCSGTDLPCDAQGKPIVDQQFRFDALDNVTTALSRFADGTSDLAVYTYDPADRCQLLEVSHNHSEPGSIAFTYDDNGNQLVDERTQQLRYDPQGRLQGVYAQTGAVLSQYGYDGHDHLVSVTQGSDAPTLRFHDDDRLATTVQGQTTTHYLYNGDTPLGQQQVDDPAQTLLLASNASNSVVAEMQQEQLRTTVYSAYGERSSVSGEPLLSLPGFNGEVRDPVSGWYLLGRGYRAYNPALMRFHSPDNLSPFGAGGLNPYAYCVGNPIAFQDPTGHSVGVLEYRNFQVNKTALVVNLLMTVGFTALAVGTLGSASPFIISLTLVGAGSGAIGTGYTTAAMLERDPEKAQRLLEIGNTFRRAEMLVGIGMFAGAMGKSALKGVAKSASNAAPPGYPSFATRRYRHNQSWDNRKYRNDMAWENRVYRFKDSPVDNASPSPELSRAATPTSISSFDSNWTATTPTELPVAPAPTRLAPKLAEKPVIKAAQWAPVQTSSGLKRATSIPTPGNATWQFNTTITTRTIH